MDVLLIHQIFVTPDEGGGTRHYEMCRYLVRLGYRISVIASEIDYLSGKKRERREENREGIQIFYTTAASDVHRSIFSRALNFFTFAFSSIRKGFSLPRVDVVWGTSPPLFQAFNSLVLARLKGAYFIFEVRDLWLDFARQLGVVKNPLLYYTFKIIEKLIYTFADVVIVNSPGFIPHVRKSVPGNKIRIFPNGVDFQQFLSIQPEKVQAFRKKFKTVGRFVVLYAGNLGVANDIENILNAAQVLKDKQPEVLFLFFGGGLNAEKYREFCRTEKLTNVRFYPSQPKKDIPALLSIANVCLATLKDIQLFNTTYPNKVFDYMAAQRPTILAIDGAIREVVEKAKAGIFVKPGDSAELVEAILFYYSNPEIARQHGRNGLQYVRKYFDREKIASDFGRFLTTLKRKSNFKNNSD